MFLSRDFCNEKLFPEKIKTFNILLKIHKTNTE